MNISYTKSFKRLILIAILGMTSYTSYAIKIKISIKGKGGATTNSSGSLTVCPVHDPNTTCATVEVDIPIFGSVPAIGGQQGEITYSDGSKNTILILKPSYVNLQEGTNEAYIQGRNLEFTILH